MTLPAPTPAPPYGDAPYLAALNDPQRQAVLTTEGRSTIEAVAPHHVTGVRHYFLDQISPEDLATIGAAFGKVNANLGPGGGCLGPQCPGTGGPAAE